MYGWEKHRYLIANVPSQDKPAGLHMLTLMDINTCGTTLRTWKHSLISTKTCLYNRTFVHFSRWLNSSNVGNHGDGTKRKRRISTVSTFRVQKETEVYFKKPWRGQRVLVDCRPLRGLVHLHAVQSVLGLSSYPPRRPCLPRCAAVYVEQQSKQLARTSSE